MIIEIENCHGCPFCNNDNEFGLSCNMADGKIEDNEMPNYDSTDLPAKCPLRNNDITVKLNHNIHIPDTSIPDPETTL